MDEPRRRATTSVRSIPGLFASAVERAASKEWLRFEDSTYTFEHAHRLIGAAASVLRDLGVTRGALVLATTRNSPDYVFTWLAVMHVGAILVPVDPKSSRAELAGLIGQVSPQVAVTDPDLRHLVEECVKGSAPGARVALARDLVAAAPAEPAPAAAPEDVAVMIPTSGTTGRSKLVMQTQRAYVMAGEGFPFWLELTEEDRLMTSLPLFHINAPAYSILGSVAAGAGLVLLPRFSAGRFIDRARHYGATEFNAIGAMLEILMRQPRRDDDADNPLRLCYTGPSPSRERQLEIEERFGLRIVCGYALSESPYGLVWRRGTRPYGTLGSVRQHPAMGEINRARVMTEGREAGPGEVGELELDNPAVMLGYYGMPEETQKVLSDGWLRTGDLVEVNADGTYTFVGRRKELIRRRGENLSPVEVEAALESHPGVAEAAVVGVPSELSEEEIKAFVVLEDGGAVTAAELRDLAKERLAPFKVPRYFEIVDELPHTPTGRIAKHELPRARTGAETDLETSEGGAPEAKRS
ncbi:MAG: AMP-binding protein [Actinomycetota bacterium]